MQNQKEAEKKQRLIVETNPNFLKLQEAVSDFKFLEDFEKQLTVTFKDVLEVKTQNNFFVEKNEDLVERVQENICQKQFGFHKKNVIQSYLKENIQMNFSQKKEPQAHENTGEDQLFPDLPQSIDLFNESEKQKFLTHYQEPIQVLQKHKLGENLLLQLLNENPLVKSLESKALSTKLEEACATLKSENESPLSDGQLKALLFEMKTYINNHQNVLRKNKDVFEQFELLDNVFPSLQEEINNTILKMHQIDNELVGIEDIKKMDELSFQVKKIIKQAFPMNDKMKMIQLSFPFSIEKLQYLMGEIPKKRLPLKELQKQLINRRKILKNLYQVGEIILKGTLQDLDQKHLQDFSTNFTKKFENESLYLNEVMMDLYHYRQNYIDIYNDGFIRLLKALQAKKQVYWGFVYYHKVYLSQKQEIEERLKEIEIFVEETGLQQMNERDIINNIKKLNRVRQDVDFAILMIENKQVSRDLFLNQKVLQTLKEAWPFTNGCLKRIKELDSTLKFVNKYLVKFKELSSLNTQMQLFSIQSASAKEKEKFSDQLVEFNKKHQDLKREVGGIEYNQVELIYRMKNQLEDFDRIQAKLFDNIFAEQIIQIIQLFRNNVQSEHGGRSE